MTLLRSVGECQTQNTINMAGQPGFIYLLKVRQHIDNDVNVYKIGQTGDLANRLHGYPKGSTLIMALQVADKVLAERAAISALRSSCVARYDIGDEYFEGVLNEIVPLVSNVVAQFLPVQDFIVMTKRIPNHVGENLDLPAWTTASCEKVLDSFMTVHRERYETAAVPLHSFVTEIRKFAIQNRMRCHTLSKANVEAKLLENEDCIVGERNGVDGRVILFPGHIPATPPCVQEEPAPAPLTDAVDAFLAERYDVTLNNNDVVPVAELYDAFQASVYANDIAKSTVSIHLHGKGILSLIGRRIPYRNIRVYSGIRQKVEGVAATE